MPIGLGYVANSFTAILGAIDASSAPPFRWSGVISDAPIVTLTDAVTVTTASSLLISNTAVSAGEAIGLLQRHRLIIANCRAVFLPLIRE